MEQTQRRGKGWLYAIIIVLILIIIGLIVFFVFNNKTTVSTTTSTASPAPITSEKVDKAKFNQYFSSFELAKLPVGQKISDTIQPVTTTVFTSGDQFCTNMVALQNIPKTSLSVQTDNVTTGQTALVRANYPVAITTGGNGGCDKLTIAVGSYQYKIYIDNILISVLPFEVK